VFHAERSVESRELREKRLVSTRRRETPFLSDSLLDRSKADSPLSANPGQLVHACEGPLPVIFSGSSGDRPMNGSGLGLAAPRVQAQSD
jgi:hypothetical protein